MAAEGWIGMGWPAEHGGGSGPPIERVIVAEEMIAAGAPIAAMWFADRQMGPTLIAYGTAEQQVEYLPAMLAGETTWCIGMSEPDAGSDLAALSTSAVRDGDEWVINGQKIWTSFGEVADYCYLICRTGRDGPPHRGISEIIVPMDTPGIEVRPITDMTANRHFCEVYFTDVRVPVHSSGGGGGRRVQADDAPARARARRYRPVGLQPGALRDGAGGGGPHRPARAPGDRRARDRLPGGPAARVPRGAPAGAGRVLGGHQVFLHRAPAARRPLRGRRCSVPEAALDTEWTRQLAYAPGYTIMGGTSNVMRNILGERVLGLPREPRV